MKNAALLSHIRQLCALGLGGRAIMPALLAAVRELAPSDEAEFTWVDAEGEVANLYAERLPPEPVLGYYFRRPDEEGGQAFGSRFRALVAQEEPVTALAATEAVRRTDYFRDVLTHLGAEHALHAVVRRHGRPLGQLTLYRRDRAHPYAAGERAAIASISGYLGHGAAEPSAATPAEDRDYADTDHQAMVIVARDGALRHCSSAARRLLLYVALESINRGTLAQQHAAIGGVMRRVAAHLREARPPMPSSNLLVANRWGRFVLRAHWLTDASEGDEALIGVQVRRQEPLVLRLSQAMRGLALSPQQKEVGLLVAQGRSNPQIASQLGVTLNTANYHVKQLFAKLNTHERSEVGPKLLGLAEAGGAPVSALI